MKKALIYLFALINIIMVIVFWWQGSSFFIMSGSWSQIAIAIGRLFGLFAELCLLAQLVLVGRIVWVEKEFGHDKMNRLHRIIGYSIAFFILLHPTFLTIGYAYTNHVSIWGQFLNFLTTWEDVFAAFIALLLFGAAIIFSLPAVRKKLKYEYWRLTHLIVYLAIALVFNHQINTADVSAGAGLYYWLILNLGIGAVYLFYRFIRPLYLFWRHRFYIEKVVQETADVYSVYISGRHMQKFKFQEGQFAHYLFLAKGIWEPHPFSFSSAYNGEYIRISVKGVGDYTKKIPTLQPGTRVIIDGPLGVFTEKSAWYKDKYLFIAGGIGITPLRSMTESLSKKGKDIILLYGNRSEKDIAFEKELELFAHKYHIVLSEISNAKFEQGFIDKEKITRLAPDFLEREIYVCGPPVMMNAIISTLNSLKVPKSQIHFERFGY